MKNGTKNSIELASKILNIVSENKVGDALTALTISLSTVMEHAGFDNLHGVEGAAQILTDGVLGEGYEVRIIQKQDA